MIEDVRRHSLLPQLPGLRPKKGYDYPNSDFESWQEVWKGLKSIERSCNEEKHAGWIQMGTPSLFTSDFTILCRFGCILGGGCLEEV